MALAALIAFFEDPDHKHNYDTNEKRQTFCEDLICGYRFLYNKTEGDDLKV